MTFDSIIPTSASTLPQADSLATVTGDLSSESGTNRFRQALLSRIHQTMGLNGESKEDQAQLAARQFVSTALVMPLLKQLRSSPFKSEYFHGGQGEDAFGPQLDQILSDRIVQRMSTPHEDAVTGTVSQSLGLVDAVYKRIVKQADAGAPQPASLPASPLARRKVDVHG